MPRLNVRLLRILRPHVSTNDLVAMFYIDSSFRWCCVSLVQRSTRQKLGNFVGVEREFPKFCNTIWIQLHDFSDRVRKNIHLHEYSQSSDKLTITGQVKFYAYKFYKSQISSLCYLLWNCKIVKVNYATKTCNLKRPTCQIFVVKLRNGQTRFPAILVLGLHYYNSKRNKTAKNGRNHRLFQSFWNIRSKERDTNFPGIVQTRFIRGRRSPLHLSTSHHYPCPWIPPIPFSRRFVVLSRSRPLFFVSDPLISRTIAYSCGPHNWIIAHSTSLYTDR